MVRSSSETAVRRGAPFPYPRPLAGPWGAGDQRHRAASRGCACRHWAVPGLQWVSPAPHPPRASPSAPAFGPGPCSPPLLGRFPSRAARGPPGGGEGGRGADPPPPHPHPPRGELRSRGLGLLQRVRSPDPRRGSAPPALRATPSPEVTELVCRLPLPTLSCLTRGCSPWRPVAVSGTALCKPARGAHRGRPPRCQASVFMGSRASDGRVRWPPGRPLTRSSSPGSWSLGNPIRRTHRAVNKKSRYSPSLPRASPGTCRVAAMSEAGPAAPPCHSPAARQGREGGARPAPGDAPDHILVRSRAPVGLHKSLEC